MKLALAATLALFCMTSVHAQTPAEPALDLNLPSKPDASIANAAAPTANDPPGKYYGDVGGNDDLVAHSHVSGSVSTAVGYGKGYGTGFSTAADLNLETQLKNGSEFNMNIHVDRSNGFPRRVQYGYGRVPE